MTILMRPATVDDATILFEWRNDDLTRKMSKYTSPVSWIDHMEWLSLRLARDNPNLFIAEENNTPVATFRLDGDHISYTVDPKHRRRGVVTSVLKLVRETFGPRIAEIKQSNIASIKAARSSGHIVVLLPD